MITLSAPLRGGVRGVLAADLKLDKFSDLVQAQRPGEHGTAVIFDAFGVILAHPILPAYWNMRGTIPRTRRCRRSTKSGTG